MATNGTNHNEGLSKDEVGWYFVEQYYTTLSKNPNRLHLFYGKKSQLVYGTETEVADISVGRQDIQERIAKLDFQDCKVRVSNVDSQASLENILIQVIGEISNKSEDSRKFVQTFVLAEQQSGYFVLNDIFRYIKEEEAESTEAAAAAAPAEEEKAAAAEEAKPEETQAPAVKAVEADAAKPKLDAAVVNKKLEEVSAEKASAVPAVATPADPAPAKAVVPAIPAVPAVATPASAPAPAPAAYTEKVAQEVAEEEQKKTETPKEPASTPAAAPAAPAAVPATASAAAAAPVAAAPTEPEKPKGPPKPMTWASRAAAAAGPARPVAVPKPAAAAAAASASPASSTAAPAKPAAAATVAPAAVAAAKAADADAKDSGEWQTAGADSKRQNRPQSISGPPQDKDSALGYIKYVTDKVDEATLRSHLETFGPVVYFDISRTKNCAFIEFGSTAGYQAAVAANPHTINGETIVVEARRPKAGAYGGSNYNPNRGNLANRGRGGYEGRNGSQGGGRGGFTGPNRGRGGAGASRGRGGAQLAA
ncbi:hypothetical protein HMPREF1624_00148 [Sporothrix schenckii ATCC 58251]|uniref:NTF2 domain-containing protein n=1 Tax=Sporothrix schenckii (strain ATCC 58251 / de Perez 2211183) TaxID=1391915 RepID=U7Q1R5_SPOS1|nr:hypothetical protein HMPREF1624_00148 [Sporothrix schenckii ATCC 58251]